MLRLNCKKTSTLDLLLDLQKSAEPHKRSNGCDLCLLAICADGATRRKVSKNLTVAFLSTAAQVQANENASFELPCCNVIINQ